MKRLIVFIPAKLKVAGSGESFFEILALSERKTVDFSKKTLSWGGGGSFFEMSGTFVESVKEIPSK